MFGLGLLKGTAIGLTGGIVIGLVIASVLLVNDEETRKYNDL